MDGIYSFNCIWILSDSYFKLVSLNRHLFHGNDITNTTENFPRKIFRFSFICNNICHYIGCVSGWVCFYLLYIQFTNIYIYSRVKRKRSNLTISFPILNVIMIEKLLLYIMSYQKCCCHKRWIGPLSIILSANFISILKITLKRSASFLSVKLNHVMYQRKMLSAFRTTEKNNF